MKKIIFIIIESVKRELNSNHISPQSIKRNYKVVIGQKDILEN